MLFQIELPVDECCFFSESNRGKGYRLVIEFRTKSDMHKAQESLEDSIRKRPREDEK